MAGLADLLADRNIRPRRLTPNTDQKLVCPRCNGGRTREACLSLHIDEDGRGATWQCFRAGCGWTEGVREAGSRGGSGGDGKAAGTPSKRRETPPPVPAPAIATSEPHDKMLDWFESRGISDDTVGAFDIQRARMWFPGLGREEPCIVFPYKRGGVVISRKYRSAGKHFAQDKGTERILFNLDGIAEDLLYWCEGEMDVLSVWEAGIRSVTTLPDGAPQKLRAEDDPERQDDKRFAALANCAERVFAIPRHIIATDGDGPGEILAEELARRLGRDNCWRVKWPEGCKDANDVLMKHGREVLRQLLENPERWPIAGVGQFTEAMAERAFTEEPPPQRMLFPNLPFITLPEGQGRLVVVTGTPGSGKSAWLNAGMVNLAKTYGWGFGCCPLEWVPWQEMAISLMETLVGKPFRRGPAEFMTREERAAAAAFVKARWWFMNGESAQQVSVEWLIGTMRLLMLRHGIRMFVLDPWNRMEHRRPPEKAAHEYIGWALNQFQRFAQQHGAVVCIVAHPAKLLRQGDRRPVPTGYDISGAAAWVDYTDIGLTVNRPAKGEPITQVIAWKVRFRCDGSPGIGYFRFDRLTGQYHPYTPLGDEKERWEQGLG